MPYVHIAKKSSVIMCEARYRPSSSFVGTGVVKNARAAKDTVIYNIILLHVCSFLCLKLLYAPFAVLLFQYSYH